MNITKNNKKILIDEYEYILTEIKNSDNIDEKLFFFSAFFGAAQRIYNLEYDATLVFMHFVLQQVHNGIKHRLDAVKQGDSLIMIDDGHIKKLEQLSTLLIDKIKASKPIYNTLEEFVELLYSTTGNGYYLKRKNLTPWQSIN